MNRPQWQRGLALALALIVFSGCRRVEPLDLTVEAGTPAAFQQWRGRSLDRLTDAQRQDVDTAIQELKFKLMAEGLSGSATIDEELSKRVKGKSVRELIGIGLTAKFERLEQERSAITTIVAQNAVLVTREGDQASADYLQRRRDEHLRKRSALEQEMNAIRERMKAAGLIPPELKPLAADPEQVGAVSEAPEVAPQRERR